MEAGFLTQCFMENRFGIKELALKKRSKIFFYLWPKWARKQNLRNNAFFQQRWQGAQGLSDQEETTVRRTSVVERL